MPLMPNGKAHTPNPSRPPTKSGPSSAPSIKSSKSSLRGGEKPIADLIISIFNYAKYDYQTIVLYPHKRRYAETHRLKPPARPIHYTNPDYERECIEDFIWATCPSVAYDLLTMWEDEVLRTGKVKKPPDPHPPHKARRTKGKQK